MQQNQWPYLPSSGANNSPKRAPIKPESAVVSNMLSDPSEEHMRTLDPEHHANISTQCAGNVGGKSTNVPPSCLRCAAYTVAITTVILVFIVYLPATIEIAQIVFGCLRVNCLVGKYGW